MHRRTLAIAVVITLISCTETSAPPPPVAAVRITPDSTFVYIHGATQLSAAAYDASGHPLSGHPITWSSADTAIATVDSTGLVRGVRVGSVYLEATAEARHAFARIDAELAIAQLAVSPKHFAIGVSDTFQMSGVPLDSTGHPIAGRVVSWTSTDPSIASVTFLGRVIGHTLGVVRVTGTSEGHTDTSHVIVGVPVDSLHVGPRATQLHAGDSLHVTDTLFGRGGQPPTDSTVTWTSADSTIAGVTSAGVVHARHIGSSTVTASAGRAQASLQVRVTVPTATLTITPADTAVLFGDLISYVVIGRDSAGDTLTQYQELCLTGCNTTYPVTLTSLDTTIAAFVSCCTIRGRSAGVDTVVAVSDGLTARARVQVSFLGFQSVAVGGDRACGLAVDSVAYCWVGGHPAQVSRPIRLSSMSLGLGAFFGPGECGLAPTGVAYCFSDSALVVGPGHTYSLLAVGITFACGLDTGGSAWCWNGGSAGQLGNGDTVSSSTPVAVAGGHAFRALSAGADHACAIASDSTAYCWGSNGGGMLGTGDTSVHISPSPVPVAGGLKFKAISAGVGYSCGVTTSDDAYCWGGNGNGDLGTGDSVNSAVPLLVTGGLKYTTISTGLDHTCAVSTTGDAYCWGGDGYLGNGSFGASTAPVLVSGGLTFLSIGVTSAGNVNGTCGLTTNGVYCWGYGLTGVDGASLELAPVKVQGQQ